MMEVYPKMIYLPNYRSGQRLQVNLLLCLRKNVLGEIMETNSFGVESAFMIDYGSNKLVLKGDSTIYI